MAFLLPAADKQHPAFQKPSGDRLWLLLGKVLLLKLMTGFNSPKGDLSLPWALLNGFGLLPPQAFLLTVTASPVPPTG